MNRCQIRVGDMFHFGNIVREEGADVIVAMATPGGFNAVINANGREHLYLRELDRNHGVEFEVRIVAFNAFDAPNENFEISFMVVN